MDPAGSRFGVRVQVQGIEGRPLVLVNGEGAQLQDLRSTPVMVKRARIPASRKRVQHVLRADEVENVPFRPSRIICGLYRAGAGHPGHTEEKLRSRSLQSSPDRLRRRGEPPHQLRREGSVEARAEQMSCWESEEQTRRSAVMPLDPVMDQNGLKDRRAEPESEEAPLAPPSPSQQHEQRTGGEAELQELGRSRQEQLKLRHRLTDTEKQLQTSADQLRRARRTRDQSRSEARDLQQQLSDLHHQLDSSRSSEAGERDGFLQDRRELRSEFQALQRMQQEQEEVLQCRERELKALQGALEEEVSAHARDVHTLHQRHQQEVRALHGATEEAKQSVELLGQKVLEVAAEKATHQNRISELSRSRDLLQREVKALEEQLSTAQQTQSQETRLQERVRQLTVETESLEAELKLVRQREEHVCGANRALRRRLEETQAELGRLSHSYRELQEKLQEESQTLQELQRRKSQLEEERRSQDRELERLQEEMKAVLTCSERETQKMQDEVDVIREQSQTDLQTLHTQLHGTHTQTRTHTQAAEEHQRELWALQEKLSLCASELQETQARSQQLQKTLQDLEESRNTHIRIMEGRLGELEKSVEEERSSSDALMKRLERGREQVEQARAELMQERSARQQLACDRAGLERQNKDLRARVSQLEACQRCEQDSALSRLQELEEALLTEETEKRRLQQTNRKLERRSNEVKLQLDEERLLLQDQRDQLALRLKTLKRQLDEAEEELEKLENDKKKLQRDAEEQLEDNQRLRDELSSLRREIRLSRGSRRRPDDEEASDSTLDSQ